MSKTPSPKQTSSESDDDGRGCMLFIGAVIVGLCIGNIYGAVYGWLLVGGIFILGAITGRDK